MANNPKNPAGEAPFSFPNLTLPSMPGMEALLDAHKRNMEALAEANRIAIEGAQAVAKRQGEMMQQALAELGETVRALAAPEGAQARTARQADLLKQAYDRAVANTRELAELIRRSNGEALDVLNKRFAEAMDEVKTLVEKAGATK
jgi:phasin family protein